MKDHQILIDNLKCVGCKMCQQDCPVDNIKIADNIAVIKEQNCTMCGHCVAICPKNAVFMTGFEEQPIEGSQTILEPNQLLNAIQTRRSIRQFKSQGISNEIVAKIIEAGRWTPSARNAQDVSYIVLDTKNRLLEDIAVKKFRRLMPIAKIFDSGIKNVEIDDNFFFKKAPIVIMILSKNKIDASLAASNMELMAQANGLGVLYSGLFSIAVNISGKLKKLLNIKRNTKVITTLVIGYPKVKYFRTAPKEKANIKYFS